MIRMLLGLTCLLAFSAQAAPPNILLLVAEDLSPRLGAWGDPVAHTPNIDELAAAGTRFTNAFTTAGVCAPSRAALITGLHQISFGAQHMRASNGPLGEYLAQPPAQARAFPELLRAAGYFTFTDSKLDYQFSGVLAGSGPFTLWDREAAADDAFRERQPGQPFFGLINFAETHESGVMRPDGEAHSASHRQTQQFRAQRKLVAPALTDPASILLPPYYPDLPAVRRDMARHYDNIRAMDQRVGRILATLEADELLEETIIIWTTDHGDGLPRAKRELFDSGIHVPLIVVQPGQTAASDSRLLSFVDLAPTILRWAGIALPTYLHGFPIDGEQRREHVFAARDRIDEVMDRQRAVRSQRYKYIRSWYPEVPGGHQLNYRDNLDMVRAMRAAYQAGELNPAQRQWFEPVARERLYDLHSDPHELNNLAEAGSHREIVQALSTTLDTFLARVGDTGALSEAALMQTFLQDGQIPVTPPPEFELKGGKLHLSSPGGASVGYRYSGERHWRLYTAPLEPAGLEAKAVRYGWRESTPARYEHP